MRRPRDLSRPEGRKLRVAEAHAILRLGGKVSARVRADRLQKGSDDRHLASRGLDPKIFPVRVVLQGLEEYLGHIELKEFDGYYWEPYQVCDYREVEQ